MNRSKLGEFYERTFGVSMSDEKRPDRSPRIQVATVDIAVLRIGSKQMTQAVFKQLPRCAFLAFFGDLTGVPWGWVNYDVREETLHTIGLNAPGDIEISCLYRPFILEKNGVLHRCDVPWSFTYWSRGRSSKKSVNIPDKLTGATVGSVELDEVSLQDTLLKVTVPQMNRSSGKVALAYPKFAAAPQLFIAV